MHYIISFYLLVGVLCGNSVAQTAEFTEREITFRNGDVELQGTLLLQAGQDSMPAVVFLHGSGPHVRAGFRPYAEEFARLGIAGLFFDKRGSGSSGGSWTTSSLKDLAGDALAAVEFLKNTEGIDPDRIGFWGVSQAAWVAPLAASMSEDIAFMILISGGGASPLESELFSYKREFERAGLSETQKEEALEVLDHYFRYLETGEERPALVAQLENLKETWMKPLTEQLLRVVPSVENQPNWRWVAVYDPVPDIEKLDMPILLMFGD